MTSSHRAGPLHGGKAVVITGASSGIGRLAALSFAREGARVVVGARNERGLRSLEAEAHGLAGSILAVPTDVADETQVRRLADAAVEAHGRIDVWVNNAGVMVYATVRDTDADELRRVLEVNVLGVHHGIRAALPIMDRQGGGTIVNVGSVESIRALPLQGAYAASKHAVKALTESLRLELAHERSPVRVVLLEPTYINTPLFDHARSKIGSRPQPIPPLYEPEVVVGTLLRVVERPVDEVVVGATGKALTLLERLSPRLADAALKVGGIAFRAQRSDEPPGPDNLFAPLDETGSVRGRWASWSFGRSRYTEVLGLHPVRRRIGVLGGLVVAGFLVSRR